MTNKKTPEANVDTNETVSVKIIGSVQFQPGEKAISGKQSVTSDVAEQLIEAGLAEKAE